MNEVEKLRKELGLSDGQLLTNSSDCLLLGGFKYQIQYLKLSSKSSLTLLTSQSFVPQSL